MTTEDPSSRLRRSLRHLKYESKDSPTALSQTTTTTTTTTTDTVKTATSTPFKRHASSSSPIPKSSASSRPGRAPRRSSSKYTPPQTYAHLTHLTDILAPNLLLIFVGLNPGVTTARSGHAYAHPSNLFWRLLHSSGLTERRLAPEEDVNLPALYAYGNTNIVARPSRDGGELSKAEMVEGAGVLEAKVARWRPEAVVLVGKGIWEAVWRWKYGRQMPREEFKWGWQGEEHNMGRGGVGFEDGVGNEDDGDAVVEGNRLRAMEGERQGVGEGENDERGQAIPWHGARVFVATSTSGLAASLRPAEKEDIWRPLGQWAQERRAQRAEMSRYKENALDPNTKLEAM